MGPEGPGCDYPEQPECIVLEMYVFSIYMFTFEIPCKFNFATIKIKMLDEMPGDTPFVVRFPDHVLD